MASEDKQQNSAQRDIPRSNARCFWPSFQNVCCFLEKVSTLSGQNNRVWLGLLRRDVVDSFVNRDWRD
jgi:hypothetical protein